MLKWLAILASLLALTPPAFAKDVAAMSPDEITNLQRRLTDAKCYTGTIDGQRSTALDAAIKACPDQEPMLRIETGMHIAAIKRFGVDAACTVMATGSEDKTLRLWSMPDGKLIDTLRLPIGPSNGGKIYVTAVSSNGRMVAAGGWDLAWDKFGTVGVYLYDRQFHTIRHIVVVANRIHALAFSIDGKRLAIGSGERSGLRVVDVSSGQIIATDPNYGGNVHGLEFGADGSLWSSSDDGSIRRYDRSLKLQARIKAPDGERPIGIALSPSGKLLVVGYSDKPTVSILDATTLRFSAKADVTGLTNGSLASVVWDADGTTFVAAGDTTKKNSDDKWYRIMRRFAADGKPVGKDLPIADTTVTGLKSCNGQIIFAAFDPAFGLINGSGAETTLQGPRTADMRDKLGYALTTSEDGRILRFGLGIGGYLPVKFDLPAATLTDDLLITSELSPPRTEGLDLKNWRDDEHPTLAGSPLLSSRNELSHSLAIQPNNAGFVLGTNWHLRAFSADGKQRWQILSPSLARGVNFARDGKLVITAMRDGTIRWYRWSDGKELLALFIDKPTRRWVAWTPSGYYLASPGGEELIGWQVNRGWEQLADFYPASRFRDTYSRPDIVQKVLLTLDEDEAVKQANAEFRHKGDRKPIVTELPPVVTIAAPKNGDSFSSGSVNIDYAIRSPSDLKVTGLDVLIDGRPADGQRGLGRADADQLAACPAFGNRAPGQTGADTSCHLTLDLPPHDVDVALIARAGDKASEPAKVHLIYAGKPPEPATILKPKLYVLAIGVSNYVDPNLQLGLPAKDARDFADAFQHQEGGLYGKVTVKTLINGDATRDNVLEGFEWLEKQVTSRDIGMVFMAGHGTFDTSGEFWFLPVDATPAKLRTRGVSNEDIRGSLSRLAGKAVLFLDACHAAGVTGEKLAMAEKTRGVVDINSVINEFSSSENGVVVFGSSTGRELSLESAAWGNGAFTKAVVEGIGAGKADYLHNGAITVSELDVYVADRVKDLTDGRQHPVMNKPGTVPDFPIGTAQKP